MEIIKKTYDYIDEYKELNAKQEKYNTIKKLNEMASNQKLISELFIPNFGLIIETIEVNIFYPIYKNINSMTLPKKTNLYWMNMKELYKMFQKLINNDECNSNILKKYITANFLNEFVQLFKSNINEERNYIKIILHKIYTKIIPRRKIIRQIITNYLSYIIKQKNNYNGIKEILDIMSSIAAGFEKPLREEHKNFFKNIIIPLHKLEKLSLYFENLKRCTCLFLTKNSNLSIRLLDYIIKIWPFENYNKEKLYIEEMNAIFFLTNKDKLETIIEKLIKNIIKCLSENNWNIVVHTLSFFKNEEFIKIILKYDKILFNLIFPELNNLGKNHWNQKKKHIFIELKNNLLKIYQNNNKAKKSPNKMHKTTLINRNNKKLRKSVENKDNPYASLNNDGINDIKLYPKDLEEEEKQLQLALKLSEKESKSKLLKEQQEDYLIKVDIDFYKEEENNINDINEKSIYDSLDISHLGINEVKEEELDEEFGICPITQEFMENPVLCPSGHHYEKSAILKWLEKNDTEPLTRMHLTADMLVEDKAFKKKIIEYRKKYNK